MFVLESSSYIRKLQILIQCLAEKASKSEKKIINYYISVENYSEKKASKLKERIKEKKRREETKIYTISRKVLH